MHIIMKHILRLVNQYTSGLGMEFPPSKNSFGDGLRSFALHMSANFSSNDLPTGIMAYPPAHTTVVNFRDFNQILAVGDSTMEQLILAMPKHLKDGRDVHFVKIQAPLNKKTRVATFSAASTKLRSLVGNIDQQTLVLFNSGIWDLLDASSGDGDFFRSHIHEFGEWSTTIKKDFHGATIVYKNTGAVHPHVVNCVKSTHDTNSRAGCYKRVQYMSDSRVRLLNRLQGIVLSHQGLRTLDHYSVTHRADRFSKPYDGRHYLPHLCEMVWGYWSNTPIPGVATGFNQRGGVGGYSILMVFMILFNHM